MMTINEAREEVSKCDQEIQSIKAALRGIVNVDSSSEKNELKIAFTKVEGFPDVSSPSSSSSSSSKPVVISLQLSSPIENGTVALNETIAFTGVDTAMAVLTIDSVKDLTDTITLGMAKDPNIEVAPLCVLEDPKNLKKEYTTDLSIPILKKGEDGDAAATEAIETETEAVICTVTLQVSYKPSSKDQREELYDSLNKTSQRKATALSELRKLSTTAATTTKEGADSSADGSNDSNSKESGAYSSSSKPNKSPSSVKAGFLNRGGGGTKSAKSTTGDDDDDKSKKKKGGFLLVSSNVKRWFERVTGPESIIRKAAFMTFVTKDYWIFLGAVGFFHYRGQVLALPPPV